MKTKIDCRYAEKMLQDYIDNELAAAERPLVENHLKACPGCGNRLEKLRGTLKILSSIKGVEPSPFLKSRILTAIAENREQDSLLARLVQDGKIFLPAFSFIFLILFAASSVKEQVSPESVYAAGIIKTAPGASLIGDSAVKYDDIVSVLLDADL